MLPLSSPTLSHHSKQPSAHSNPFSEKFEIHVKTSARFASLKIVCSGMMDETRVAIHFSLFLFALHCYIPRKKGELSGKLRRREKGRKSSWMWSFTLLNLLNLNIALSSLRKLNGIIFTSESALKRCWNQSGDWKRPREITLEMETVMNAKFSDKNVRFCHLKLRRRHYWLRWKPQNAVRWKIFPQRRSVFPPHRYW